ncbi:MAG TPA: GNAT family N-acetyltransferase [Candidatus Binataceae bacterium]|nr:GNAT family N-acetyltransferase [Candidatus Binataceae bacterium]
MIVIKRRLAGILSYQRIFFADEATLPSLIESLRSNEIARVFHSSRRLAPGGSIIACERTFTVCNDLRQPLERLWQGFAPYARAEIRKAQRLGDRVRIACNESADARDFLAVFNEFARLKDGVTPLSANALALYDHLADRVVLYLDGQPMVVNLVLRDRDSGRVRGLHNASRRLTVDERRQARMLGNLNRLLHWDNMRRYKEAGFSTYDWGGIGERRDDGRSKFKMSFGGQVQEEYTYLCAGWPRLGQIANRLFGIPAARARMARFLRPSDELFRDARLAGHTSDGATHAR